MDRETPSEHALQRHARETERQQVYRRFVDYTMIREARPHSAAPDAAESCS